MAVTVWMCTVGHITQHLYISKFVRDIWKDLTGFLTFPVKPQPFPEKLTKLTHADSSFAFILINICFAVGLRRLYPGFWSGRSLNALIQSAVQVQVSDWSAVSMGIFQGFQLTETAAMCCIKVRLKIIFTLEMFFFPLLDCLSESVNNQLWHTWYNFSSDHL